MLCNRYKRVLPLALIVVSIYGCSKPNANETSPAPLPEPNLDFSDVLAGPDANKNGVRDDLDELIERYSLDSDQKKALTRFAATVQSMLLESKDSYSAYQNTVAMMRAQECLAIRIPDYERYAQALHAYTMNTDVRAIAYINYQNFLGGAVFSDLSEDPCNESISNKSSN